MRKLLLISLIFTFTNFVSHAENKEKCYFIKICTTSGDITVKLYNKTPIHRDNFIKLCKAKYYNDILFHRVIDKFMIQTGDPDSKAHEQGKLYGNGGPDYKLPAEIDDNLFHKRGVIAAARESDFENPKRESSASQFYIVTGKVRTDKELDETEIRIDNRNADNKINTKYKFTPERRDIYKTLGGTPHLDTQYTVFGEVTEGMEVVDKISAMETDDNDRPKTDIWIKSTKVFKKRQKINN